MLNTLFFTIFTANKAHHERQQINLITIENII